MGGGSRGGPDFARARPGFAARGSVSEIRDFEIRDFEIRDFAEIRDFETRDFAEIRDFARIPRIRLPASLGAREADPAYRSIEGAPVNTHRPPPRPSAAPRRGARRAGAVSALG
jgi:hypothetical protein